MIYSGVLVEIRAAIGIASFNKNKLRKEIHSYMLINEKIIKICLKAQRSHVTIVEYMDLEKVK